MDPSRDPDSADSSFRSARLLREAMAGDHSAIEALFARYLPRLHRWAHGRLPPWARRLADTGDMVQDALIRTFRRLDKFEPRGNGALQAYLQQAVRNRINDEIRQTSRQAVHELIDSDSVSLDPSPLDQAVEAQDYARYRAALMRLGEGDRELVVSRLELRYNYEQIALISNKATPNAARVAVRRAVVKLAEEMDRV